MPLAHFCLRAHGSRPFGRRMMVRKSIALALVAGSLLVAGCNTVSGAGKDLQSASKDTKDAINGR
jgi:predicted small secreted protein